MPYNYFSSSLSLSKGEKFKSRMEKNCSFLYAPKSSGSLWWPQVLLCWCRPDMLPYGGILFSVLVLDFPFWPSSLYFHRQFRELSTEVQILELEWIFPICITSYLCWVLPAVELFSFELNSLQWRDPSMCFAARHSFSDGDLCFWLICAECHIPPWWTSLSLSFCLGKWLCIPVSCFCHCFLNLLEDLASLILWPLTLFNSLR